MPLVRPRLELTPARRTLNLEVGDVSLTYLRLSSSRLQFYSLRGFYYPRVTALNFDFGVLGHVCRSFTGHTSAQRCVSFIPHIMVVYGGENSEGWRIARSTGFSGCHPDARGPGLGISTAWAPLFHLQSCVCLQTKTHSDNPFRFRAEGAN